MIDRMTGGAMGAGIDGILAALTRQNLLLERLVSQTVPAPLSHPDAIPQRYTLSSTNPNARWLTPGAVKIVGLCVGGDTSGRGVLQIGADSAIGLPIWVGASLTAMFWFSERQEMDIAEGIELIWIPPGGTTWDMTIFYHLKEPIGRKAK